MRRVPSDLTDVLKERQFKRSLKHRDERLPAFKAVYDAVHREIENYITKVRKGLSALDAHQEYQLAAIRAQRIGFDLRSMDELASDETSIDELVERLIAVENKIDDPSDRDTDAVLGAVQKPKITFPEALNIYADLNKVELRGKNPSQQRRWRNPLDLAVRNFIDLIGPKPLDEISRNDALRFREWWVEERIGHDVGSANTANKNLMALRKIFKTVNDTHRLGLENPFQGLSISATGSKPRVSLTRQWLEEVMLGDQVLSGLNPEAVGVIWAMADTGARVNEITGLAPEDIVLSAQIPHIVLRPNAIRSPKTAHSERTIPLVGTTLKAMRDHPSGFQRYAGKNASASGAINKFLRSNDLLPDGGSLYGLRHGFQDRLIEVEAPERIQADLMGHKTLRPKYGKGPSLEQMQDWLSKTALNVRKSG